MNLAPIRGESCVVSHFGFRCRRPTKRDPERLPPPPFWRTRYFAFDVLPRRPYLDPLDIKRILARPDRKLVQ